MRLKSTSLRTELEPSSKPKSLSLSIDPSKSARKSAFKKDRQKLDAVKSAKQVKKPSCPPKARHLIPPPPRVQHKVVQKSPVSSKSKRASDQSPRSSKSKRTPDQSPRSSKASSKTTQQKKKGNQALPSNDKLNKSKQGTTQKTKEWIADARQDDLEPRNADNLVDEREGGEEFPTVYIGPYEELLACSGSESFVEQQRYYEELKRQTVPNVANATNMCRMSCLDEFPSIDQMLISQAVQEIKSTASDDNKCDKKEEVIASKDPALETIPLKKLVFGDKVSFSEYFEHANEGLKSILMGEDSCSAKEFMEFLADWDGASYNSLTSSGSLETGFKTQETAESAYKSFVSVDTGVDTGEVSVGSELSLSQSGSSHESTEVTVENAKNDSKLKEDDGCQCIAPSGSSISVETEVLPTSVGSKVSNQPSFVEDTIHDLHRNENACGDDLQHFEVQLSTSSLGRLDEGSVKTAASKLSKQDLRVKLKKKTAGLDAIIGKAKEKRAKEEEISHVNTSTTKANAGGSLSQKPSIESLKLNETPSSLDKQMAESVSYLMLQAKSEESQCVSPSKSTNDVSVSSDVDSFSMATSHLLEKNQKVHNGGGDLKTEFVATKNNLGLSGSELKRAEKKAFAISLRPLRESKNGCLRNSYSTGDESNQSFGAENAHAAELPALRLPSKTTTEPDDTEKRETATVCAQDMDWDAFIASGIQAKSTSTTLPPDWDAFLASQAAMTSPATSASCVLPKKESKAPSKMSLVKSFFGKAKKKRCSEELQHYDFA